MFDSLDASEEAYINKVIIPDENVRISTKGIQLLPRFLYRYLVVKIEVTIKQAAIEIGFMVEMATRVTKAITDEMSLVFLLIYKINVLLLTFRE